MSGTTNVPDPDGAGQALANMAVRMTGGPAKNGGALAEIKGIIADITSMEGKKPWGDNEYGHKFEESYFGKSGNAAFVKENAHKLLEHAGDAAHAGFEGMMRTVQIDLDGKSALKPFDMQQAASGNVPGAQLTGNAKDGYSKDGYATDSQGNQI